MTDDPAPILPPQPDRLSRWPTVLAWVVIVACIGLIVVAGLRPRPAIDPGAVDPARVASTELLIQSRMAVGLHHLMGGGTQAGAGQTPAASFVGQIDQLADTPVDRLRAVPVLAEIGGPLDAGQEARQRLDALAGDPDFPDALRPDLQALRTIYNLGPGALTPSERAAVVARHGWFGELALAYGLPDEDPARGAALRPAIRTVWTIFGLLALAGIAGVVGIGLLVWAVVAALDGRLRPAYVPAPPGRSGPFVEAFALYLVGMLVVGLAVAWLTPRAGFAANWVLALAVPPALLWPRVRGLGWDEVRAGFGWSRGRGFWREAGAGVAGYVAALPLMALAVVVSSVLARLSGTTPSHPIAEEVGRAGLLQSLQLFALASVYAPVVEELMFRGALYHHVRGKLPWWLAAVGVGVLFAAIHPQGWVGIPMLATVALAFAALREWRGAIIAPVVAHACVNTVTMTMLVLLTA
jgi:membrane protease YdiL (CAAX protease family)